jgi:2-dehydro-3-deoxy-D-pentonate aldolase
MVEEYMHMINVLRESNGSQPSLMALVGFEDWSLPALLTGAAGAICGLPNIAPELFNGLVRTFEDGDLAKATELHRRILPLVAIFTLGSPGLSSMKLAMKKLGFPLSPTMRGPTMRSPALPTPPNYEEAIETTLKAAGLLPVQGEA